jgi:histidinol dehydrogenase
MVEAQIPVDFSEIARVGGPLVTAVLILVIGFGYLVFLIIDNHNKAISNITVTSNQSIHKLLEHTLQYPEKLERICSEVKREGENNVRAYKTVCDEFKADRATNLAALNNIYGVMNGISKDITEIKTQKTIENVIKLEHKQQHQEDYNHQWKIQQS